MKKKIILFILGPTCVGKTNLSIYLAKKFKTEILSIDSRQFYKELKIGTSMPDEKALNTVPHHFIGHLHFYQNYNAKLFETDFLKKTSKLFHKYSILIAVGGSSLYEKSITEGLCHIPDIDPKIHNELIVHYKKKGIQYLQKEFLNIKNQNDVMDIHNPRRLIRYIEIFKSTGKTPLFFWKKNKKKRNFITLKVGLFLPKNEIFNRIHIRVNSMIKKGLLHEAKKFYPYKNLNSLQTIGYKEIYSFLEKKEKICIKNVIKNIEINTRKYVKKQITWYKKYQDITWFDPKNQVDILNFISRKWAILDLNQ
ncbi:tRNA (adenosine(37)-N6)-dimethylallyltransferase MiaA [Blattabacterium cuenoti]|uniref:tRNA (adenosine(37)-N6)-dimethylallyltransferase MiaA n=1 Tax=Blattabacterium cuenoti TaxID=1653831 RepID=UPI001EEC8E9B|nr:tRNA (adenosine(37)-N6)-dimethylallyltransferase MiaA [Blattabacterium cuenoti]